MFGSPRTRAPGGFTLVEMLVAVGVIVFLVGLTVSAGTALARQAEVRRTRSLIGLLDSALLEWEVAADRKLRRGDGDGFDLQARTQYVFVITELLDVIARNEAAAATLARIEPEHTYTYRAAEVPPWLTPGEQRYLDAYAGGLTILDAWGVPIYSTHPGETAALGAPLRDEDGTERTPNEIEYGVAQGRQVCFVSAGPDRLFGLRREFAHLNGAALEEALAEARSDNIYSYPVTVP